MKKAAFLTLAAISFLIYQNSYGQNYVPFSTTIAKWDCLFWNQWGPTDIVLTNYKYIMSGDTLIKGRQYKKMFFKDDFSNPLRYIGGLREDTSRQIFFFPYSTSFMTTAPITFPNDTVEQLLYTFNNLSIGTTLPINTGNAVITVNGIDSVLVGTTYHKRYAIHNQNMLGMPEYWIEGIGSTKELFSPFTYEFEWIFYTLCYEDSMSYHINNPNQNSLDSCHYMSGLKEYSANSIFQTYPNPASNHLTIESSTLFKEATISILNIESQILIQQTMQQPQTIIDVSGFARGMYFVKINSDKGIEIKKFVKE